MRVFFYNYFYPSNSNRSRKPRNEVDSIFVRKRHLSLVMDGNPGPGSLTNLWYILSSLDKEV